MKKHLFSLVAVCLLFLMAIHIAYQWGYMQSAIDAKVAYFSAPAYVSVFTGIPYLIAAVIASILAIYFRRKK